MDSDRFDALTRSLASAGSRRQAVRGLAAAAAALLGGLGLGLDRDDAAAHNLLKRCRKIEDKKKRAACIKKAKKHKRRHAVSAPPSAPQCTADSCPLPPGCSQPAFDACAEDLRAAAERSCGQECQDNPDSPACLTCLKPIVKNSLPDIEACLVAACDSTASASTARASSRGDVSTAAWWTRACSKSCCKSEHEQCREDARDSFLACSVPALAAAVASGPAGAAAYLVCVGVFLYSIDKCVARNGCVDGQECIKDGVCCSGAKICGNECCSGSRICVDEQASLCCYDMQTACGDKCCWEGWETCCNGVCCSEPKICDGGTCKCPDGRLTCGNTCCHAAAVACSSNGACLNQCDLDPHGCGG